MTKFILWLQKPTLCYVLQKLHIPIWEEPILNEIELFLEDDNKLEESKGSGKNTDFEVLKKSQNLQCHLQFSIIWDLNYFAVWFHGEIIKDLAEGMAMTQSLSNW